METFNGESLKTQVSLLDLDAKKLDREIQNIITSNKKLRVTSHWVDKEIYILKKLMDRVSPVVIAKQLNRTVPSVKGKIFEIKSNERK